MSSTYLVQTLPQPNRRHWRHPHVGGRRNTKTRLNGSEFLYPMWASDYRRAPPIINIRKNAEMSAPVILSPNPANPHPNGLGSPLGGELLQWGPFQMTNYALDMYGGPGTVELIGASALVNSSFTLDRSSLLPIL
jgi:hypothetical protein